jgi:hypothetical protein
MARKTEREEATLYLAYALILSWPPVPAEKPKEEVGPKNLSKTSPNQQVNQNQN